MSFFIDMFYFLKISVGPRGLMDKASDFGSEDCEFESRRGRYFIEICFEYHTIHSKRGKMQQTEQSHKQQKVALSAGFEPAREDPNGFLVHRLNHSATTTVLVVPAACD